MAIRFTGMASGLDTDTIIKDLMKAQSAKKVKIQNNITLLDWKKEKWQELNSKIYKLYTGSVSKMRLQGSYNVKSVASTDESKATVTGGTNAVTGSHNLKINQLASAQYVTGDRLLQINGVAADVTESTKLSELGVSGNVEPISITVGGTTKTLTLDNNSTIADFVTACKDAGINANFDATQKRIFVSSAGSGADKAFDITSSGADINTNVLARLGLNIVDGSGTYTLNKTASSYVAAADSKIELNGVELTGTTNTITANGLTFNLKAVTAKGATSAEDEVLNLTVSNNSQAVYDMVKNFLTEYNSLLGELNTLYSAPSTRGYNPLTDEEKEAMTDKQIEQWETKIKDSILRRDEKIEGVSTVLRSIATTSIEVDGKNYALSSFGITSTHYTEKGKLHIDGDKDDIYTADLPDKLMNALNENPETVTKVFTELSTKLFTGLQEKMKSSELSSAFTVYNDKEMSKMKTRYEDDLSILEERLLDMEDRYYAQFTALEKAMQELNNQNSSLASMLGTSN